MGIFHQSLLGYPLFIQIALVMIVISITLFFFANALLAFERMSSAYRERRINTASKMVNAELTENLMMQDQLSEPALKTLTNNINTMVFSNKLVKQVVIDQIIFYHKNFTDNTERLLNVLFNKLNLIESAIKKVKKGSWELKAKGLKEIQEMETNSPMSDLIDPLLNDKNHDLRIEAQAAYLRLNKEDPFAFLNFATEELLEWHQIILYEIITNTPELPRPNIIPLLHSTNESVVSFSIKLVVYYQMLDVMPVLIQLMDHPAEKIRKEAITALGNLNVEEAEAKMIAKYPNEDLKVQIRLLTAIGTIGSGKSYHFLKEQFLSSEDFFIIKAAGCALAIYPSFDKEKLLAEVIGLSPLHHQIIEHCTNTLIRN